MALTRKDIHKALSTKLKAEFSLPSKIAWENVAFKVVPEEPYFEEIFIPNVSGDSTVMKNGWVREIGFYQIKVKVPVGTSTLQADDYIDELTQIYEAGTSIIKNTTSVHIKNTVAAQGFRVDDRYIVPFNIEWFCDLKK